MKATRTKIFLICLILLAAVATVSADTIANVPISSINAGKEETGFGDLVADALRSAANADIALVAAVSCKPGTIPAGTVTAVQLAGLLQNPGEVWAVASLTGEQIDAAMEKSVSRLPGTNNGYLQVSGITVTYDSDGLRNNRVRQITVGSAPLAAAKKYTVAMPLSLAKGGSGYFTVFDASSIVGEPSTQSLIEAVTDSVFAMRSITYNGTGRLISQ